MSAAPVDDPYLPVRQHSSQFRRQPDVAGIAARARAAIDAYGADIPHLGRQAVFDQELYRIAGGNGVGDCTWITEHTLFGRTYKS